MMRMNPYIFRSGLGDASEGCAPGTFQDPASPWLTDGSGNPSTTPHCVINTYSARVYESLGVPPDIAAALPPGFDPTRPAVPGAVSVAQWWAAPSQVGGCPVIDLGANMCGAADPSTGAFIIAGCNMYRECDSLTGARHVEYGLPGGPSGNVTKDNPGTGPGYGGDVTDAFSSFGVSQAGLTINQQIAAAIQQKTAAQKAAQSGVVLQQPGVATAGNTSSGNPVNATPGGGGVVNNYYVTGGGGNAIPSTDASANATPGGGGGAAGNVNLFGLSISLVMLAVLAVGAIFLLKGK